MITIGHNKIHTHTYIYIPESNGNFMFDFLKELPCYYGIIDSD